jgi:membrane protein required for colicin V production
MEGFTVVDGAVALVILLSGVLAYSRGFVREALSIAGWVGAAVAAWYFAPMATPLVQEIPILSEFLGDSCELSVIAAFAGVFAIALILISIFTPVFAGAVQRSALGGVDQGLGFLFGVARGILLVAVALIIYDRVMIGETVDIVENSRTNAILANFSDRVAAEIPSEAPGWFVQRYEELMATCGPSVTVTDGIELPGTPATEAPATDAPATEAPAEQAPAGN